MSRQNPNQMSSRSEKAHAGLPQAEDYNPEAIGTAQLEAGDPEQVWEEFGLEKVPVLMDGEDTGRRLIRRNGNFISDVTDDYQLLPNERAVAAANDVARELGAEPFHEFDGDWYVQLDDHVYQDADRRRVHALYAWDTEKWGDEEIEFGFAVHNSIDGSMSFSVDLFSFRHACANMVLMGVSNMPEQVEQERQVLKSATHKHTKGLEVDREHLADYIEAVLTFVDGVNETYQEWAQNRLKPEDIKPLLGKLPAKDLPEWVQNAEDAIERAHDSGQLEDSPLTEEDIIASEMPEGETVWETYNDLTQSVWHDDATNDQSKRRKMKKLHRVFEPADGLR